MPWYMWLLLVLVFGTVIGGLLMLRSGAKKIPLTEEQLKEIKERNARLDAQEREYRK
ncbi:MULTISPECIES: DUF2897 family protein [Pseudomonas]|uniref:DUF2897 domain-containing protein n=1 Tax=Pseudomonas flexibilis TaxID=706570 RepID=A0A1N7BGQ5_9PSED|nr:MULTISPECIES: DUF2897 family protein [Pseudomonas]KHL68847.1 hypothetical protein SF06_23800 [Pseudomonas flexibilis]SCY58932.1 Protein of unknown function [Pseudomonas flexibilis]SIR50510.1 Protein of unknown function [Pseudomonas flexibilis]